MHVFDMARDKNTVCMFELRIEAIYNSYNDRWRKLKKACYQMSGKGWIGPRGVCLRKY